MTDEICGCEHHGIKDDIYRALAKDKKILLNGNIDSSIIEKAVMQVFQYNDDDDEHEQESKSYDRAQDPIFIFLNTNGGKVYDALALVSAIQQSKTPVVCVALGKCMSAGIPILVAGHVSLAMKYSTLMYHQVMSAAIGDLAFIEDRAKELKRLQKVCDGIVVENTEMKKDDLTERIHKTDWFFSPQEAKKLGIIKEIL